MLFKYQAKDSGNKLIEGVVDSSSIDSAISAIQRRGLYVISVKPSGDGKGLLNYKISAFDRVKSRDLVLLSRQLSTLFGAQVSALRIFRMIAGETESPVLRMHLNEVAEDLQSGSSISNAMSHHPKVFSEFYINMVRAGEESGKLDETFKFLADSMERSYNLLSKAKNALMYPVFVIVTFIGVMVLMLTTVIPKLTTMLTETGQEIPIYTKIVIVTSDFFVRYGIFLLVGLIIGGFFLFRFVKTPKGKLSFDRFKISLPYIGNLYRKLYIARLASNLSTMLQASIPIVKTLEVTAKVIDNAVYEDIINQTAKDIRGGSQLSYSMARHPEIPGIMIAMIRVGEETGEMGEILKTIARFYEREVVEAVDSLVGLIEPALVVALGLGVGFLLASVLIPIYNVSMGIA